MFIQNKTFNFTKDELLFFLAYIILLVYSVVKSSTVGLDDNGVSYIIVSLLLVWRVLMMKVKRESIICVIILCPLIILCISKTWDPIVPIVFMMLLSSKRIDFNKIVKVSFFIVFFLVIIIVGFSLAGILSDNITYRIFNGALVECHSVGFNHASALPTYFCYLFLEYFYLKKGKVNYFTLMLWLVVGVIIFRVCAVRLRFFLFLIACAFALFSKIISTRFAQVKKIMLIGAFPILCVISMALGYYYSPSNKILYNLNIFLSNRLYLENLTFKHYGIKLFGQTLEMGENAILENGIMQYFYVDSGYVYIFTIYGWVVGFLILITYSVGAIKVAKKMNYALFVWFVCIAVDSLVGNRMLSIWINPLLFIPFCHVKCLEES